MPRSRNRRRSVYTPPQEKAPVKLGSPSWVAPLMVACFLIGLVWLVVYYVSQAALPIPPSTGLPHWSNLLAGFAFIIAGFGISTQWK